MSPFHEHGIGTLESGNIFLNHGLDMTGFRPVLKPMAAVVKMGEDFSGADELIICQISAGPGVCEIPLKKRE